MELDVLQPLTTHGQGPYPCYRIPGIVATRRATLLAYCETRLDMGDWSTRGAGLFRSTDGGLHWSGPRMLVETADPVAINNPVMIAGSDGRVHFFWQKDYDRGYHQVSLDDGITFSPPVEITAFLKREDFAWDAFAFGPGHGLALSDGRLLLPIWLAHGGYRAHMPSVFSTLVSSDGGITWQRGDLLEGSADLTNPNETAAVQLQNGSLLFNLRHTGPSPYRAVMISPDGLSNFSAIRFDSQLPDPQCFGSLCRVTGQTLAFSNCAVSPQDEPRARVRLTLRLSHDEGHSWQESLELAPLGGYSDVAASPDGQWVYCFFEHRLPDQSHSGPHHLTFARIRV